MKHLLIPEGSDLKEIWGRVIVPPIRDKYQSMKYNINSKIKSIYLSMRFLLEFARTLLIVVACTNLTEFVVMIYICTGDNKVGMVGTRTKCGVH
jgi:hypothetical protein